MPSRHYHHSYQHSAGRESRVRIIVDKRSLRVILKWTQRALFSASAVLLAYCAVVVTDTWMFQRREHRRLEGILETVAQTKAPVSLVDGAFHDGALQDGLMGSIDIARLRLSVIVMEGDDPTTLRRAAGHIPNSGVPGQPGNIAVAAHRDTLFRPLRHVRRNDIVVFKTPGGEYRYRVVSTKVVKPTDVRVLNPDDGTQILTLITCYPFYFVGSAPDRFIVRAERIT
jgi:sortase A